MFLALSNSAEAFDEFEHLQCHVVNSVALGIMAAWTARR